MSELLNMIRARAQKDPRQMDLFSAATLPPMGHPGNSQPTTKSQPSHGGYPQTTAGANGTSAAPTPNWPFGSGVGSTLPVNSVTGNSNNVVTSNAPAYAFNAAAPNWGTITIDGNGQFTVSTAEVDTIDDYSFTFKDNGVDRKAILAPEYDITPMETLKLIRLMHAAPMNLNKLQYVKNNNLLRHFRLE